MDPRLNMDRIPGTVNFQAGSAKYPLPEALMGPESKVIVPDCGADFCKLHRNRRGFFALPAASTALKV